MALRSYKIDVQTKQDLEAMEFLIRDQIYKGKNLVEAVTSFAKEHQKKTLQKESYPTLVTENQLLEIAKEKGFTTGKSSIVQYRQKGVLKDENGPWYFQNAQHKIVYHLEPMLKFLEARFNEPKSRIKKKNPGVHCSHTCIHCN